MIARAIALIPAIASAVSAHAVMAQSSVAYVGQSDTCTESEGETGPSDPCEVAPAKGETTEERLEELPSKKRIFPLGGRWAIERGYRIPEPWGIGALYVKNNAILNGEDLSVAVRKGVAPPPDAPLLPLPSVTARRIESDTELAGFKADLWLFPPVNVFIAIGKVKGTTAIDIDIDLDQLVPFPFCRPAQPCGTITLPFEAEVDNTTITLGTLLVYGSESWFIAGSVAKTLSVSSKERSDVESTNIAVRLGPRLPLGGDSHVSPYVGANYFDLKTRVSGLVSTGALFDDGEGISLRYDIELEANKPWAVLAGLNVEVSRHIFIQGELQAGEHSTRGLTTVSFRF